MAFSLLPKIIVPSLTDVSVELLQSRNIRLLMLDFDNTIVPYTTSTPTEEMKAWFADMAGSDIRLCIVSNSHKDRVKVFAAEYGISCITHSRKPFPKGIRECLQKFSADPKECALVGDQIFTDTLGANCTGVTSILVNAIDNHNIWLKLRHVAELPFIFLARKRRIVK